MLEKRSWRELFAICRSHIQMHAYVSMTTCSMTCQNYAHDVRVPGQAGPFRSTAHTTCGNGYKRLNMVRRTDQIRCTSVTLALLLACFSFQYAYSGSFLPEFRTTDQLTFQATRFPCPPVHSEPQCVRRTHLSLTLSTTQRSPES